MCSSVGQSCWLLTERIPLNVNQVKIRCISNMGPTSKAARKAINARYYQKNKEDRYKRNKKAREKSIEFLISVKKNAICCDCHRSYHPEVMEFDHVRGEKRECVSVMVYRQGFSISEIKKEIEKCDIVCANCHRMRTVLRKSSHSGRAPGS